MSGVFFLNKINLDDRRRNTGLYFEKGINYMILNSIRENNATENGGALFASAGTLDVKTETVLSASSTTNAP